MSPLYAAAPSQEWRYDDSASPPGSHHRSVLSSAPVCEHVPTFPGLPNFPGRPLPQLTPAARNTDDDMTQPPDPDPSNEPSRDDDTRTAGPPASPAPPWSPPPAPPAPPATGWQQPTTPGYGQPYASGQPYPPTQPYQQQGQYPPSGPYPPQGSYPPPPPGYAGYPPGGYGYPPVPKTNSLAIASLVLSCLGLFCGVTAIVGVALGHVALGQIKQRGENGRGLALAGVIVGYAVIVLLVVAVGVGVYGQGQS